MLADSLLENRVLRFVNEKIMSPGHKKQMAQAVVGHGLCSPRRACRILRLARATLWYRVENDGRAEETQIAGRSRGCGGVWGGRLRGGWAWGSSGKGADHA
jgi:hypothetical protein